ncbi:hypothetical protein A2625_00370 [candidate division WOR-1 bacterium RIFCSPHIGHO2_01_FULL_53_15]|uniref:Type II secretion system protein GspG C-terminal domain-containing protein n=1 Tax=candidate division WOR-1 bacterium RIFCSPHIGHO2_01_FULL_53_15 TaxID=1802564 RepID=A0A1F4PZ87_UNCSA|nr:MAG: hypothetical protein A2625_00370 [candidate division WOR-1 bacterium RIFCSPHIGHO2_01_FULL_53_15]OGC10475.1 MAG: hypothetical protein A3D23_03460 [candidate division WOR-1 bacterium RIFCSPHIGHO2_02_FULL_53_26]
MTIKRRSNRHRAGFTLVETVMGLIIIGIAFYTLIAVFISLAPRTAQYETMNKKIYLAQEKMEEFLVKPFSQETSVAPAAFAGNFSNYNYEVVVTYVTSTDLNTAVGGPTNYKNINVRVWGGPTGGANTAEIRSLVTSYEAK